MKYLQSLSDYLIEHLVDKNRIESWAENGELFFTPGTGDDGYEVKYLANFEMSDVNIDPTKLFMMIASWVQKYNPERESEGVEPPKFFVERLDNRRYDIGVKMEFTEQIKLVESDQGEWSVGGQKMALYNTFDDLLDVDNTEDLIIFDSHTQDNGLQK